MKYYSIEQDFNTNQSLRMPHSVGAAQQKLIDIVNSENGEIVNVHISEYEDPFSMDHDRRGTVAILYKAEGLTSRMFKGM